jgi:hypothetical protein
MSENGDTSEYELRRDDASGGLSGDILAAGSIEPPRRNVAAIVVSLVAVLAVIAGGVAYVGYHKLASSGAQPDQWAPSSSIAYIKIDLDPAASEKIAALRFEQKFPDAPHVTSADQLKDALLSEAFAQPSTDIDYATDIKPWLGDRVALAVYPEASGEIRIVGILQVKDATQAKAGLTKLIHTPGDDAMSTAGFAIEDDYAIVGQSQAVVDEAVAAARTSSITASNQYASDVATLGGDRIVTAWADLGGVEKYVAKREASQLSSLGALGGLGTLGSLGGLSQLSGAQGLTNELKGRLVFGLSLQSGYASISGRLVGGDTSTFQSQNADAGTLLGQLPAGSVAGVAVSGIGPAISKELTMLESGPLASLGFKNELDAASAELGISLPGDAVNLVGNGAAIGLDSVPADGAKAKFTGITEPTDPAKGLKTAQALAGLLTTNGFATTATASGAKVIVTNDAAASGSLSDDPGFKSAMGGMPSQVVAAAYVDLAGIWPSAGSDVPSDLQHLTGIGTYEALDGSDVTFSIRVTVN